ncbi:unnamed protein product [Heterotrigona itama]|uniref:Uncharacterized protein n=1 Tax=Heterotrigona itama TaxID=395501 RepID=A0A6V7GYE5_9HYME|nr:unnamed protein product [Heterotrigona itama]
MKPFAGGEIKECSTAVAEIAFPDKKDIISKIGSSRFTIGRRIEDLSENIIATLSERIHKFEWCSLTLESCDISDKSQLAIFVRGIDSNFDISEELCSLVPMKGTTTGREIFVNHCIIHQQNLCAKILNMPNVITPVIKLINFLKPRAFNHCQFKKFLKNLGSEYSDVICNTEMRWLSREMKEYPFPQFQDKEWICDFAFLVDITQNLNDKYGTSRKKPVYS